MHLMTLMMVLSLAAPFAYVRPLYDAARGTTPDRQDMVLLVVPPLGAQATQSFAGGATTLDTTAATGDFAGYFGDDTPVLDRAKGYSLHFALAIPREQHNLSDRNGDGVDDRAGFSVIVLSSDRRGIELGFWQNRVWAQDDASDGASGLFTQAEGAELDTMVRRSYELRIKDDGYTLFADGAAVLAGRLRDYTPFVGPIDPYERPNLVFLGDDTSSAAARVRLEYVAVELPGYAAALPFVRSG